MKYQWTELDSNLAILEDWNIQKVGNIIFVVSKSPPPYDEAYVLYHKKNNKTFLLVSDLKLNSFTHIELFNTLLKIAKIPKDTKFIDCISGLVFLKKTRSNKWYKTVPAGPETFVFNNLRSSDPEFKNIELIEKLLQKGTKFGSDFKIPKLTPKRTDEPKIKLPQKVKPKIPIRRLK
ncbi:MAG: hypothetical protein WCX82_03200 [archaeon]|jgi:hypothetical protein